MLDQIYIDAFTKCYPQHRCEVKRRFNKQGQFIGFAVGINGDFGNMILTTDDMRAAVRNFQR